MCTSEAEIGIVVQLVGDGGLRAMASIDDGLGREGCHDMVQALLHLLPAALGKVGTTDAHAEQRVAGEYGMLLFAIEEAGAVGMAGCLEHLQRMGAEGDGIVLPEKTGYGGCWLLTASTPMKRRVCSAMCSISRASSAHTSTCS